VAENSRGLVKNRIDWRENKINTLTTEFIGEKTNKLFFLSSQ
jgi:hypothetical protein